MMEQMATKGLMALTWVHKTQWNVSLWVQIVNSFSINSQEMQILCKELDTAILQLPYQALTQLLGNHEICLLVQQIIFLVAESADHCQTPLHMSQKIVWLMYKATTQLGWEIYVALLDQLCHAFDKVAKEVVSWLIYSDDEVMSSQLHP